MKTRCICITILLFFTGIGSMAQDLQPANPQASDEARMVLRYLDSIQGKQMLSGHHGMYRASNSRDLKYIFDATGKYPAVLELEAGIFTTKYGDEYTSRQKALVQEAIAYWKEGGIIAICWHWGNPTLPENTYPNTKIKFDIQAAFREGTPEHEAMIKDLDITADLLKELRDAKVPVLFRPLHEICGGWFWWSMQGEETAEQLWKYIYDYYTNHHGLNNLLWVYSFSHDMHMEWFPGLEYMDIVGVDIYKKGETDERPNFDIMAAVAGKKPIALSECEEIPDPDVLQERGFLWNYFSTWHGKHIRLNQPDYLKKVYQHELVITRDELPKWNQEQ